MQAAYNVPKYKCHKEVRALEIQSVTRERRPDGKVHLKFVDPTSDIEITHEWAAKHEPEGGGFYVMYEDGYTSYSPRKVFLDGYTKV